MTGLSYNLLMDPLLDQLIAGSIGEDGRCDGVAAIPIGRSELHIGTFFASVILSA
jgi:hypothetical protein